MKRTRFHCDVAASQTLLLLFSSRRHLDRRAVPTLLRLPVSIIAVQAVQIMQDPSRQHSPVSSPSPMSTESMQKTKMSDTDFNMTEAGDLRPRRPDTRDLSTATSRDQVEKLKDRIEPQLNDTRSGLRRNHDSEERMCEEVEARLSDKSQNRPSGKVSSDILETRHSD